MSSFWPTKCIVCIPVLVMKYNWSSTTPAKLGCTLSTNKFVSNSEMQTNLISLVDNKSNQKSAKLFRMKNFLWFKCSSHTKAEKVHWQIPLTARNSKDIVYQLLLGSFNLSIIPLFICRKDNAFTWDTTK